MTLSRFFMLASTCLGLAGSVSAPFAAAYFYKVPATGMASATPAPVTAVVGDGTSKAGACASGPLTGCATWDKTGTPSNFLIASDLLSVQADGMGASRGSIGKLAGKWFWEIQLLTPSNALLVGTGTGALSLANPFTATPPMWGWYSTSSPGNAQICGAWQGGSVTATTGDVIGVALDLTAHLVTYYKNGVPVITCPNITATEAVYPVLGNGGLQISVKANFGQTNFQYPVPAGYNAGLW